MPWQSPRGRRNLADQSKSRREFGAGAMEARTGKYSSTRCEKTRGRPCCSRTRLSILRGALPATWRSEEHTSELQSQSNLVCRLLLEKKKNHSAPPTRADGISPP